MGILYPEDSDDRFRQSIDSSHPNMKNDFSRVNFQKLSLPRRSKKIFSQIVTSRHSYVMQMNVPIET